MLLLLDWLIGSDADLFLCFLWWWKRGCWRRGEKRKGSRINFFFGLKSSPTRDQDDYFEMIARLVIVVVMAVGDDGGGAGVVVQVVQVVLQHRTTPYRN